MTAMAARLCIALSVASVLLAEAPGSSGASGYKKWDEKALKAEPLTELPYSPSLDVTAMDPSVNPCVDFYHYTCGGWIKKNPIPPDQARWDVYGKLQYENEMFLWGILEEAAKPVTNRSAAPHEIGDYFQACMDEEGVEKADAAPLKPALDAIAHLSSTHELAELAAREHLDGVRTIFGFGANQDFEDSNRLIAFATAGGC